MDAQDWFHRNSVVDAQPCSPVDPVDQQACSLVVDPLDTQRVIPWVVEWGLRISDMTQQRRRGASKWSDILPRGDSRHKNAVFLLEIEFTTQVGNKVNNAPPIKNISLRQEARRSS